MALNISPHIAARITAIIDAGEYPDADTLLDHLLAPLETETIDPQLASLLQAGIDDAANGRYEELTDELWTEVRREAHDRYLHGERPAEHVRP